MKKKFEPYVSVISRFYGSSNRIGEELDLPDSEWTDHESSPSPTPPSSRIQLAQAARREMRLLNDNPSQLIESSTPLKPNTLESEAKISTASKLAVDTGKMALNIAADEPAQALTPTSCKPLITMFAALPESEQRLFAASNPMASIIKGKTRVAEEKLRLEKETTAYLLTKVSELQALLTEAKQINNNKAQDFNMFTKAELRNLMTSSGPAKDIIAELVARGVSEKALERGRGLSDVDMYKLYCEHPDVGEVFETHCKNALLNYKLLCKDSYMSSLREVEKDNKIWLIHQREDLVKVLREGGDVNDWLEKMGPSPAERALQNPMMWATPDIPRDPAVATENVKAAAEKARASLEGINKRKLSDGTDKDSVHKRVMRPMGEKI